MKKIILFVGMTFLVIFSCVYADDFDITLKSGLYEKYSTDGFVYADEMVLQSDLWIQHQSGLWFDIWGSAGFKEETRLDDELDLGIGWAGKGPWNSEILVGTWYFFIEETGPISDMLKSRFEISFPEVGKLSPFLALSHYQSFGQIDGGNALFGGFSYQRDFSQRFTLNIKTYLMYQDGYFGLEPSSRICPSIGLSTEAFGGTIGLGIRWSIPLDKYESDSTLGIEFTKKF